MRRPSAVLLLVISLLAWASPPASAHTKRWDSRVIWYTQTSTGGQVIEVGGFVKSQQDACVPSRYVEVYAGDEFYGADPSTDADGKWLISGAKPQGQIYTAKVLRYTLPSAGGHSHVCRGDTAKRQQ